MDTYRHSGRPGSSVFLAPLLATAAALLLGLVYAYVDVWSPIAGYISILFVAGFAFGLISALGIIAKIGKCRSPGFMMLVGVWTGLVALYGSWAFFVYALLSRFGDSLEASIFDVLFAPGLVWHLVLEINENGWYSIRDMTPTGGMLWFFWGVEALLIVGGSIRGGKMAVTDEVFCEACQEWRDESPTDARMIVPEGENLAELANWDLARLESLMPAAGNYNPHLLVAVKQCPQCKEMAVAQLRLIRFEADEDGKISVQTGDIGEMRMLTPEEHQRLALVAERPPVDPTEAAAAG